MTLGVNDRAIPTETPADVAANLRTLRDQLAPVPVLIAPPFPCTADAACATWVTSVRDALATAGLLTGPDWPPLPTADGVHLTPAGYAAAAGLWLGVLP